MSRYPLRLLALATVAAMFGTAYCAPAWAADPLESGPLWQAPNSDDVEAQAMAWLAEKKSGAAVRAKAAELWANTPEQAGDLQVLDCLVATFALADGKAAALADLCSRPKTGPTLPDQAWLADPQTPPLVANNLRLFFGRWLAQESLYDEALEQLSGLKPEDVVAPACLLFYQGVVHHRLLDDPEEALKAIEQLLAGPEQSPQRYVDVAYLIEQDLSGLEDDSLDHVARRMDDIRRRLDLGRAGQKVRGIEDGVIASLDKLIKEAEEQQQQCSCSGAGNTIRSMAPAQDSQIMAGKGPGNVTPRSLEEEGGWGDLPPKEREAVLQQIGREFPSHYRDVIEQYFRRLAAEGGE